MSESNSTQQVSSSEGQTGFNRQVTFDGKDSTDYKNRIEKLKSKQNIQHHVYKEREWNNSFSLDKPDMGIFAIFCFVVYLFFLNFTHYLENDTKKYIWGFVVLLIYIIDCFNNGCLDYINNIMTMSQFEQYIDKIKNIPIKLKYQVKSFHQESRNGFTKRSRSSRVSVTTFQEVFNFPLTKVIDKTDEIKSFEQKTKIYKAHSFFTYSYGDKQSEEYIDGMRKYEEVKASKLDTQFTGEEIVEYGEDGKYKLKNFIVVQDKSQIDPMLNKFVYFFYCLTGTVLLYQILLNKRIPYVELCFHKTIFVDTSKPYEEHLYNKDVVAANTAQIQLELSQKQAQIDANQKQLEEMMKKTEQLANSSKKFTDNNNEGQDKKEK